MLRKSPRWTDGDYRFLVHIADPFRGESFVNVTPWDNDPLFDDSAAPCIWLELEQDGDGAIYTGSASKKR